MLTLHLNDHEQQALVEVLEREIPNLRHEIHHTDDRDYREFLKAREHLLEQLLAMVKTPTTGTSSSPDETGKQPYSI